MPGELALAVLRAFSFRLGVACDVLV